MDPAFLAQQATDILAPALPFIYAGSTAVVGKSKDMLLERGIEKLSSEGGKRAKALLDKISPKMGASLEKALTKVSGNSNDPEAKEELQQEILKLLRENSELSREIELIVNVNIDIDVVKQLVFGGNNLIFNLEGVKGEELIKIMEYMEWKRQEELKQEVLRSYSPSILPDFSETLVKYVTENRAEELSSALKHLQKNKILLFSGIAGVGKTTLARVLVNFRPTGVPEPFWFNFYHNRDAKLEDVLEVLAAYLKAPEILSFKGKKQAGNTDINRLTEELRKRDSLWLVFDDLSYIIDEEQNFMDSGLGLLFKVLRDNTHNAKIILTSRIIPLLDNGEYLIDELEDENRQKINGLKPDFAVNYLRENGFEGIELKTLESLVESVDGHPFSLRLLVGLAKKHTAENILKDLSLYRKHQKDRVKNARFLFDKLVGGEKELLERISVYRQPEPLEAIQIILTKNIPVDYVDALLDKSLLEIDNNGNYWLHPLVQEFSYEDLKNKKEAHMLAVKYYLSLPRLENPTKKEDLQPALEAHYHACEAGEYNQAANIVWEYNLCYLLDLWGNPRKLTEIYEKLLPENDFKGEPILKDKQVHGTVLGNLGLAYSNLGEFRKAIEHFEQALKTAKEIENKTQEGEWLGWLGKAYRDLGHPRKAIEYHDQALRVAEETGDRRGKELQLGYLGVTYRNIGYPRKAIEYSERALKIARETKNKRGEEIWLGDLGNAYRHLGDSIKAIEQYKQAMKISKEIGDKRGKGTLFGDIGNAYRDLGKPRKAIKYYEYALRVSRETGNRRGEGIWLGNMGAAYCDLGEPKKAIEYHEQSLKIAKETEHRHGEGNQLRYLGDAYWSLGESEKAIEFYKQSLKIARKVEDKRGESASLKNLGLIYHDLGKPIKAVESFKELLAIGKVIEEPRIVGFCEQQLKKLEGYDD